MDDNGCLMSSWSGANRTSREIVALIVGSYLIENKSLVRRVILKAFYIPFKKDGPGQDLSLRLLSWILRFVAVVNVFALESGRLNVRPASP